MVQQYKVDKVSSLKEYFTNNKYYVFNNFSGLNVEKITQLRRQLKKLNSTFMVIKNNYIKKLLNAKNEIDFKETLFGPTAVAFAKDEINEVLKVLFNFSKDSKLIVKGGWGEDKVFSSKELEELSRLPGKKELFAKLMATMNAPVQNFAYACNDVVARFVRAVNAVKEQKAK